MLIGRYEYLRFGRFGCIPDTRADRIAKSADYMHAYCTRAFLAFEGVFPSPIIIKDACTWPKLQDKKERTAV